MPSSPAKRSRARSPSVTSDSSTNSFPDLGELNSTPIRSKSKPRPKPKDSPRAPIKSNSNPKLRESPRKIQKRDGVLGQEYIPSPAMDARIKIFAREIADDLSISMSDVTMESHMEVIAKQEVIINMEIRITTIDGKESIEHTIDPRLSQDIDLDATEEKRKAIENGNKIKEEQGGSPALMEGLDTSRVEGETVKEETDDGDGADIKTED